MYKDINVSLLILENWKKFTSFSVEVWLNKLWTFVQGNIYKFVKKNEIERHFICF